MAMMRQALIDYGETEGIPYRFDKISHRPNSFDAHRIVRAYGTTALAIFVGASCLADCGRDFGHGLTEREVRHLITREWARTAEDVLWRRTKLGLRFGPEGAASLDEFIKQECPQ